MSLEFFEQWEERNQEHMEEMQRRIDTEPWFRDHYTRPEIEKRIKLLEQAKKSQERAARNALMQRDMHREYSRPWKRFNKDLGIFQGRSIVSENKLRTEQNALRRILLHPDLKIYPNIYQTDPGLY